MEKKTTEAADPLVDDEDEILGQIVDEYFERIGTSHPATIEQLVADHPALEPIVRQTITALESINHSFVEKTSDDGEFLPRGKVLGDFRLIKRIGAGGMGIVFEAEQLSLRRRVALKVLPMAGSLQKNSIERFRNEVRAAAMLDHPGIVSVYFVGEEKGIHFFAMQLIKGHSLADVIHDIRRSKCNPADIDATSVTRGFGSLGNADNVLSDADRSFESDLENGSQKETQAFHADSSLPDEFSLSASSGKDRDYFRTCALMIKQAAEAIHYAHQVGVLHRDIKPGNLLIDSDVNVFISDFGLARIESDNGLTASHDLIGTLKYMSPEQAGLRDHIVDHRSDIYSLGATLYELITLRPIFEADDRMMLVEKIANNDPIPIRKLLPSAPRDLETIVQKSIAKDPVDRYRSAAEFADDLTSLLQTRPIKAKRPTVFSKLNKWTQRHAAFTWTLAFSTLIFLVGAIALMSYTNNAIRQERNSARAAQEESDARYVLAQDAINKYVEVLTTEDDLYELQFYNLRERLFSAIEPFFEKLVNENPADDQQRLDHARTVVQLAKVNARKGKFQEAKKFYELARRYLNEVKQPTALQPQFSIATVDIDCELGWLMFERGQRELAEEIFQTCLTRCRELRELFPDDLRVVNELTTTMDYLSETGSNESRIKLLIEAVQLGELLLKEDPLDESTHVAQGNRLVNLAEELEHVSLDESLLTYRRALNVFRKFESEEAKKACAKAYFLRAWTFYRNQKLESAVDSADLGMEILDDLIQKLPAWRKNEIRAMQIRMLFVIGQVHWKNASPSIHSLSDYPGALQELQIQNLESARESYSRAIEISSLFRERSDFIPGYELLRIDSLGKQARVVWHLGDGETAKKLFDDCIGSAMQLMEKTSNWQPAVSSRQTFCTRYAEHLAASGDWETAEQIWFEIKEMETETDAWTNSWRISRVKLMVHQHRWKGFGEDTIEIVAHDAENAERLVLGFVVTLVFRMLDGQSSLIEQNLIAVECAELLGAAFERFEIKREVVISALQPYDDRLQVLDAWQVVEAIISR